MLFTCGVAVGLYVYGVSEPLYFYRQKASWCGRGRQCSARALAGVKRLGRQPHRHISAIEQHDQRKTVRSAPEARRRIGWGQHDGLRAALSLKLSESLRERSRIV